mmetsp:Transcript_36775/g.54028  ORF Transcript_36775/g.54028 Transcript_36775/m.54028 type:complete len:112 (-) Transcript_36775:137-472(-)
MIELVMQEMQMVTLNMVVMLANGLDYFPFASVLFVHKRNISDEIYNMHACTESLSYIGPFIATKMSLRNTINRNFQIWMHLDFFQGVSSWCYTSTAYTGMLSPCVSNFLLC